MINWRNIRVHNNSNEGVSMLENAAHLGLPIPEKLKAALEQLHGRSDDSAKPGDGA